MKRSAKKLQLPKDFAEKLLDCQIQFKLSDRPSKQVVKNLIELYSQGVEYYESIRSHKYLYFQLKMTQIFSSAATISAISQQKPQEVESPLKKKMRSKVEEQKIQAYQIKQKQQKMFQQVVQNTKQSASVNTVKKIINDNDLKSLANKEKIKSQLENQETKLKDKLQKRKSRLLFSKSFTNADISGQRQTRDTLFPQNLLTEKKDQRAIKPLEVNFSNIINENDSDQEADEAKRRMSIVSNGQTGKKTKSGIDLFQNVQH